MTLQSDTGADIDMKLYDDVDPVSTNGITMQQVTGNYQPTSKADSGLLLDQLVSETLDDGDDDHDDHNGSHTNHPSDQDFEFKMRECNGQFDRNNLDNNGQGGVFKVDDSGGLNSRNITSEEMSTTEPEDCEEGEYPDDYEEDEDDVGGECADEEDYSSSEGYDDGVEEEEIEDEEEDECNATGNPERGNTSHGSSILLVDSEDEHVASAKSNCNVSESDSHNKLNSITNLNSQPLSNSAKNKDVMATTISSPSLKYNHENSLNNNSRTNTEGNECLSPPNKSVELNRNESSSLPHFKELDTFMERMSFKKKVKFTHELNAMKRQLYSEESTNDSDVEDAEEYDEEELAGWQELENWNKEKEIETKFKDVKSTLESADGACAESTKEPEAVRTEIPNVPSLDESQHSTLEKTAEDSLQVIRQVETPSYETLVPVLNEANGYFEIGNVSSSSPKEASLFVLSVTIIFVKGLHTIVPGPLLRSCRDGPHLAYSLLGCPVTTDPLRYINTNIYPSERSCARILSTNENLIKYFMQQCSLYVKLKIGEVELATCSIELSKFTEVGDANIPGKISGSYKLKPVEGNLMGTSSHNAVVGVTVELQKLKSEISDGRETVQNAQEAKEQHISEVSEEFNRLSRKREREENENSASESLLVKKARDGIKLELHPPAKKRKMEAKSFNVQDEAQLEELKSQVWEDAEKEFRTWRNAQENVLWKQWLLREKRLQESLSKEFQQRIAGLEGELIEQLEEVQQERAALEQERRLLRQRERDVQRREQQVLDLQERVLEQQRALSDQFTASRSARAACEASPSQTSLLERDRFYKSQWLRGVAATHRRWAVENHADESGPSTSLRSVESRLFGSFPSTSLRSKSSFPSSSGMSGKAAPDLSESFRINLCQDGPTVQRQTSEHMYSARKYDSGLLDEIMRLTKKRRAIEASGDSSAERIDEINKAIEALLDSSSF